MPKLYEYLGILIYFYSNEHEPIHVHGKHAGRESRAEIILANAAEKEAAAKRLMDYVTSPACKTPLEEAISQTERAHQNLVKEIQQHIGGWRERHEVYETIRYDVSHIQQNVDRVLNGKEPIKLEKPRFEPLALPSPKN
jgi:hypothetical protein